jgi:hypothetical protein
LCPQPEVLVAFRESSGTQLGDLAADAKINDLMRPVVTAATRWVREESIRDFSGLP